MHVYAFAALAALARSNLVVDRVCGMAAALQCASHVRVWRSMLTPAVQWRSVLTPALNTLKVAWRVMC